jgi:imidazolonepropionase-like amidohydrolase
MTTLLRAAGLIVSADSGYLPGHGLLVRDGRVVRSGPAESLAAEAEETLDLGDLVLAPGLIDAHTHVTVRPGEGDQHGQLAESPGWQAIRGVENLRRMLASGVTTARIMGERSGIDLDFRRAVAAGELPGPRLLVSGAALSASHGHGRVLGVADGPDGVRSAVRANIAAGVDQIKLFVTGGVSSGGDLYAHHYGREEIRVAVEEAHRVGLRVAAHAHGGPGVTLCAEEGVDTVEHGALLTSENIEAMKAHGTYLVLTNSIAFHPAGIELGDAGRPAISARLAQVRERVEESFAAVRRAGLSFAVGTDSMHGHIAFEVRWLVERGVPESEALAAATTRAAEVLGVDDIGRLTPGSRADVVALDGNPLSDVGALERVRAVVLGGRVVHRA